MSWARPETETKTEPGHGQCEGAHGSSLAALANAAAIFQLDGFEEVALAKYLADFADEPSGASRRPRQRRGPHVR